jgi:hypothetical protein
VVQRYQDLVCWQLADELKREVYKLLNESPSAGRDFDFARQLKRAASSGPANLSEGFGYYRHKESAKFVRVAKGSLIETDNHSWRWDRPRSLDCCAVRGAPDAGETRGRGDDRVAEVLDVIRGADLRM